MRARVVTALLVVGGSIAAVSWACATRDLRRLEALRRQVETDAALERARVSRRREALRGSAGPRVDASVLEACFHAIPNDTDVATIRSALASDRAPVIDAVRRAGPSAVAAAFKLEGFGRVDGLEASRIALDLWRLLHDAAREGTVEDELWAEGQWVLALRMREIAQLRLLRVAALAVHFERVHGRWPRGLEEALGRAPDERDGDPATGRALAACPNETGETFLLDSPAVLPANVSGVHLVLARDGPERVASERASRSP